MEAVPKWAVELLGGRLKPAKVEPAELKRIARLAAALDADTHEEREKASKGLVEAGAAAVPALRQVLAKPPSAEARRRASAALAKLTRDAPKADELRRLRSVEVLERIGTPGEVGVLRKLASGTEGLSLTEAASSALRRALARRM
jgi:hypothetical protein